MPKERTIHILHLTDRSLRWLSLAQAGRLLRLTDRGELEGEPEALLEQWSDGRALAGGTIRLYDGRPRYYSFTLNLPAAARRQHSAAVALRVREELGLNPGQVAWATRVRKRPEAPEIYELFTVVARRDALARLEQWGASHDVAQLWIGADIEAVRCLAETGTLEPPALVLNSEPGGAALFLAGADGGVVKGRLVRGTLSNGSLPAEVTQLAAERSILEATGFASSDWQWLSASMPSLTRMRGEGTLTLGGGRGTLHLEAPPVVAHEMDAVLAGGLRDLLARRYSPATLRLAPAGGATAIASLTEKAAVQTPQFEGLTRFEERLGLRPLVWAAALTAVALVLALGTLTTMRSRALSQLRDRVEQVRAPMEVYRSQLATLETIRGERGKTLGIIEAVMTAAPNGMLLKSIELGSDGTLALDAQSRNRNDGDAFFQALSASPLLSDVRLPMVKPGQQGQVGFQLTARVRGRGRSGR